MIKSLSFILVLSVNCALCANVALADNVRGPFFGGKMTGIYQLAALNAAGQIRSNRTKKCTDFNCLPVNKASISPNNRKLLP